MKWHGGNRDSLFLLVFCHRQARCWSIPLLLPGNTGEVISQLLLYFSWGHRTEIWPIKCEQSCTTMQVCYKRPQWFPNFLLTLCIEVRVSEIMHDGNHVAWWEIYPWVTAWKPAPRENPQQITWPSANCDKSKNKPLIFNPLWFDFVFLRS